MALKLFKVSDPITGVGGDYHKIISIELTLISQKKIDGDGIQGWQDARICFDVWRDAEARQAGLEPIPALRHSVVVPATIFQGMTVVDDNEQTLGLVYPMLKNLPDFQLAKDC